MAWISGLGSVTKPPLVEAYAIYIGFFATIRPSSAVIGPLADFTDVLRAARKDTDYSDEEWVAFLLPFTEDEDAARDLWDALLCQPSQLRAS